MATSPMTNNGKMPRCILEKEFDRKRAYDIMRRMDTELYSLAVCEWGARGFASIAGTAMTNQNAESLADFLDDGGCESLVQIMNKYAETSVVVAAYGCLTAAILAWSLRELKEFLGEIGAGEIIVFATSMHIGDAMVSEFGTSAIGLLAKQNIANSYRLAQAGACDALAQAGNFGFNLRHERASDVAANVCLAFSELAEAVNASRLMDCGASALVVELTKYHHKHEDVAKASMRAICALASLNAQHREELGRCDVCPYVVKMLYLHGAVTHLCLEGCEAIMHLSLSPTNANRLGAAGACEAVVHLLTQKLLEVDFGAEVCTGAMLNLSLYGEDAVQNRRRLVAAQVVDLLRKTQFSPRASYKARENIVTLLDLLASEMNNDSNDNHGTNTGTNNSHANPYHYHSNNTNNSHTHPHSNNHKTHNHKNTNTINNNHAAHSSHANNRHNNHLNGHSHGGNNSDDHLVSIIHGSKMIGDTVPLKVEVREVVEYASFLPFTQGRRSPSPIQEGDEEAEEDDDIISNHKNASNSTNTVHTSNNNRANTPPRTTAANSNNSSYNSNNNSSNSIMNTIFTNNNRTSNHHNNSSNNGHHHGSSVVEL